MRSRFTILLFLLVSVSAAAQDSNLNGILDRIELPGTQPAATLPGGVFQLETALPSASACSGCHLNPGELRMPMFTWSGSMMGNAARDPVFWSQLDVAERDETDLPTTLAGTRDLCLRCHIAKGWVEGRSSAAGPALANALRGMAMQEHDLLGVQCEVCHRMVDRNNVGDAIDGPQIINPLNDPSNPLVTRGIPSSYGNGMYIFDRHDVRRGPFTSSQLAYSGFLPPTNQFIPPEVYPPSASLFHPIKHSLFHRSGNLCGTCHDVSNPAWNPADPNAAPVAAKDNTQANFPIERTWTEWTHSAYPALGQNGNCQSCHMNGVLNGVITGSGSSAPTITPSPHLNDLHVHDLTGGNVWIPLVIKAMVDKYQDTKTALDPGSNPPIGVTQAERDTFLNGQYARVLRALYPAGTFANATTDARPQLFGDGSQYLAASNRAKATLQRAAQLSATVDASGLKVRVWNMTGHKLPTGYPEGRRMWLNVKFLSVNPVGGAETLAAESGRYEPGSGTLYHDFDLTPGNASKPYDVDTYTAADGVPIPSLGRRTQVYEARLHHAQSGTEFHFIRNNEIRSDNRIPPLGWNKAQYIANNAGQVRPAAYTDFQNEYNDGPDTNFDEQLYPLPVSVDVADVRLFYQGVSREYIEELVNASPHTLTYPPGVATGFTRAEILENAWRTFNIDGQTHFPPTEMVRLRVALHDTDGDGLPNSWEQAFSLDPNSADGANGRNGDPDGDGRSNWREFQDGTNPNSVDGVTHPAVDLVLVLDFSGSMNDPAPSGGGGTKIDVLKDAVEIFLRTWQQYATAGGRLGVVYFSSNVTIEGGSIIDFNALPAGTTVESRINDMIAAVRAHAAGGSTAMGGGLETALQMVLNGGAGHRKQIILFTNGMQNISPMARQNMSNQWILRAEPVSFADGVYGDSGVTATATVPFNTALQSFGAAIHTIGIGVAETADDRWLNTIRGIAQDTSGVNQFISRAFEMEGAFLNNLVTSLRGFSPHKLAELNDQLAAGAATATKTFTVDASAREATFIVSWSGEVNAPELAFALRAPNGAAVTPLGRTIRGNGYMMQTFYFPLAAMNGRPIDHAGTWTMTIGRLPGRDKQRTATVAVNYRAYLIAEIPDMDFIANFNKPVYKAGERPILSVAVLQAQAPVRTVRRVTAVLRRPSVAVGTLLATTSVSADAIRNLLTSGVDRPPDAAAAKANLILGDPKRAKRLELNTTTIELFDDGNPAHGDAAAGDGIFSAQLGSMINPGLLVADIIAEGESPQSRSFTRRLRASATVRHADFSLGRSRLFASFGGRKDGAWLVRVSVRPRDTIGNYLGPGLRDRLSFVIAGAVSVSGLADNLDGSYAQTFAVPAAALGNPIVVSVDHAPVLQRGVRLTMTLYYGRWLLLLLLILIVIIVIWLILRR